MNLIFSITYAISVVTCFFIRTSMISSAVCNQSIVRRKTLWHIGVVVVISIIQNTYQDKDVLMSTMIILVYLFISFVRVANSSEGNFEFFHDYLLMLISIGTIDQKMFFSILVIVFCVYYRKKEQIGMSQVIESALLLGEQIAIPVIIWCCHWNSNLETMLVAIFVETVVYDVNLRIGFILVTVFQEDIDEYKRKLEGYRD